MTIEYEGKPVTGIPFHVPKVLEQGAFSKRVLRRKDVQTTFHMIPEVGEPERPGDLVWYWNGKRRVELYGPRINKDSNCRRNGVSWKRSSTKQKRWLLMNRHAFKI